MATLIDEVKGDAENEFSKEIITCSLQISILHLAIASSILVAVKRKYEAERRTLKELDRGESFKKDRTKKAKYDQRKKRVCLSSLYLPCEMHDVIQ